MANFAELVLMARTDSLRRARGDLRDLTQEGARTETRTRKAMGGIGAAAKVAGAALAALGAVSWASNGIRQAREYGAAMSEVSTLIEGTPAQMKAAETATRNFAKAYGTSATQQAKAYYQAVSGGAAAGAEATKLLDTANRLAIAGVTDVASAVGILTSATNVYADSGLTAAEASDALFIAVRAGVTTIPELAASLGQVLPLAQKLGLSFDEVAAATAALTKGGINTSESVTGINAALTSIIGPSKQASDLAASLGLEFNSAALETKGFAQFMADAVEATGGGADAMRTLFGSTEATKVALALAGTAGADMAKILEDLKNKAGATDTAFFKMSEDMDQRLKVVQSRFADLQIGVGDALLTVLVPVMEKAADAATAFANAIPVEQISAAATALMGWSGLDELAMGLGAAAIAAGALVFPLTAVAIAAGVAATYIYRNWDGLKERFPQITGAMIGAVDLAKSAWSGIRTAFTDLAPAFASATASVQAVIAGDWAGAWTQAKVAAGQFVDWWGALEFPAFDWRTLMPESIDTATLDRIQQAFDDTRLAVERFGVFAQGAVTDYFTSMFSGFSGAIDPILESLGDAWAQAGPILENFREIGQKLSVLFADSATNEASVFSQLGLFVGQIASTAWQGAALIVEGLARAIETVTGAVSAILSGDFPAAAAEFVDFFNWMSGGLLQQAIDAVQGIPAGIAGAAASVQAEFAAIWDGIKAEVGSWPASMLQYGQDMMDGLIGGIKAKAQAAVDAVTGVGSRVKSTFTRFFGIQSPSKLFKGYGVNLIEGLVIGVDSQTNELVRQIEETATATVNAADQTLAQGFGSMVDYMFDGFRDGMSGIVDIFKNTLKQMAATAIKNKISIGLGLTGSVGGTAAAAGVPSSPLGGAGGILGGGISSLLGSWGGGATAGLLGGAGGVVSGLFSGGLGGAATSLSASIAGATSGLAGLGAAVGAIAVPLLAVAAVFSFFKKKVKLLDGGIRVTTEGMDALIETFKDEEIKRFWGLSKKRRVTYTEADDDVADPIMAIIAQMQGGVLDLAGALGVGRSAFADFSHQIQVSTKDMSEEEAQQAIAEALAGVGNAFADLVPHMAQFTREGEESTDTLSRIVSDLGAVNLMMDTLGHTMQDVSVIGAGTASNFAALFGGIEAMNTATTAFYQGFYTEAERLATSQRQIEAQFSALNITMPTTREQFRAMVDALDLTTEGGRKMYAALVSMSGALDTVLPSVANFTAQIEAMVGSITTQIDQIIGDTSNAMRANEQAASLWYRTASTLRAFISDMRGTAGALVSAGQARAFSEARFQTLLASAIGGDNQAAGDLTAAARTLLDNTRATARTAVEQARAEARVLADLQLVSGVSDIEGARHDVVAGLLEQQVDLLGTVRDAINSGTPLSPSDIAGLNGQLGALEGAIKAAEMINYAFLKERLAVSVDLIADADIPAALRTLLNNAATGIDATIDYIVRAENLTPDLRWLALTGSSEHIKTITMAAQDELHPWTRWIAVTQASELDKTVNMLVGADLDHETRRIALAGSSELSRTVNAVLASGMSEEAKRVALMRNEWATKTIHAAVDTGNLAPWQLKFLQSVTGSTAGTLTLGGSFQFDPSGGFSTWFGNTTFANINKPISALQNSLSALTDMVRLDLNQRQDDARKLAIASALVGTDYDANARYTAADGWTGEGAFRADFSELYDLSKALGVSLKWASGAAKGTNALRLDVERALRAAGSIAMDQMLWLSAGNAGSASVNAGWTDWLKTQNVPAFANGGTHYGGMARVGENDMELVAPSRIYNPAETRKMLSNDNSDVVRELRELTAEVARMRDENTQLAKNRGADLRRVRLIEERREAEAQI